jgi:16S rRNA (guanine527-N7)-methyltransferase
MDTSAGRRQVMPPLNWTAQRIETAFAESGIAGLPPSAYAQFLAYLELLLRWNVRLNLTAIREPEQIIRRHFVECAFVALHLPGQIETLLDFGSGAGLPGIPITICRPEVRVTLAESRGKKASFLREAVRSLSISAEVYEGRVEDMPRESLFHAVSMRAVEKMEIALPVALRRAERYLVLLTTEQSIPVYQKLAPELRWLDPIYLPNAMQTVLAIGKRTYSVPRGTFPPDFL